MRHILVHPKRREKDNSGLIEEVRQRFKDNVELHIISELEVVSIATLCGSTYEECWDPRYAYILDDEAWNRLTGKSSEFFLKPKDGDSQSFMGYSYAYDYYRLSSPYHGIVGIVNEEPKCAESGKSGLLTTVKNYAVLFVDKLKRLKTSRSK